MLEISKKKKKLKKTPKNKKAGLTLKIFGGGISSH